MGFVDEISIMNALEEADDSAQVAADLRGSYEVD
jgi:hypothetical protein